MLTNEHTALLEQARAAGQNACCPYSNFPVGAAVQTDRGIFVCCSVENASYGLAICAERAALFAAVATGAREFQQIAVSCLKPNPDDPPSSKMPCGACRQVMKEFLPQGALVIVDGAGVWQTSDLLLEAFRLTS